MENKVAQLTSVNEKELTRDNPLVSIITPVFNGIRYLEEGIQSVLKQSYPNIEHIFVDGGSSDGTLDMLASYAASCPDRVRFISGPDKNACDAANKGWGVAKGDILGLLGSDDMLEPGAIETVVEFFRANRDAYFVYGDCNIINERGEVIGKSPTSDFDFKKAVNNYDVWCIPTISAFYKREVIEKVGIMDTSLYACDTDFKLRAGKAFQPHRIEKVLSRFRIHPDSLGSSKDAAKKCIRDHFITSRRHGGSLFSPCARKYYRQVIIEGLRPILGHFYPLINKAFGALRELLSRGKQILCEEGPLSFFKHFASYLGRLLFSYDYYCIYEHRLDTPSDSLDILPKVGGLTLRAITQPEELEHLSGEGFCPSRLLRYKEAVHEGVVMFCAFMREELVYATLVFIRRGHEGYRFLFPIDYASTAWVAGDFTAPKYRGKGIHVYVQSKVFQYLKQQGLRRAWSMQSKDNMTAHNSAIKLGSYLYGEGCHLRLLSLFNFRWTRRRFPVDSRQAVR